MSSSSSLCVSSLRPRSTSWLQLVLLSVIVYVLMFSTVCCHAVPAPWKPHRGGNNNVLRAEPADIASGLDAGEYDDPDSILERCIAGDLEESSTFIKTLCSLVMVRSWDEERTRNHHMSIAKRSEFSYLYLFLILAKHLSNEDDTWRHIHDVTDSVTMLMNPQVQTWLPLWNVSKNVICECAMGHFSSFSVDGTTRPRHW